jgi:hypothetical protein
MKLPAKRPPAMFYFLKNSYVTFNYLDNWNIIQLFHLQMDS